MGLRTWFRDNRNDERDDMIVAQAAKWGFTVMSLACVALSAAWMVAGRLMDAMTIVLIASLGQIVYTAYILRMRAVR
jgi:hypothetical protein